MRYTVRLLVFMNYNVRLKRQEFRDKKYVFISSYTKDT